MSLRWMKQLSRPEMNAISQAERLVKARREASCVPKLREPVDASAQSSKQQRAA